MSEDIFKNIEINILGKKTKITLLPDLSILPCFYPLYVVALNRMVDSPVTRLCYNKHPIRLPIVAMCQDLRVMFKL